MILCTSALYVKYVAKYCCCLIHCQAVPTYLLFSALCPSLRLFPDSVDWDFVQSYISQGAPLTLRNLDDIISILCIDAVGRYRRRNQFLGQSEGTKLCREEALFLIIYLKEMCTLCAVIQTCYQDMTQAVLLAHQGHGGGRQLVIYSILSYSINGTA